MVGICEILRGSIGGAEFLSPYVQPFIIVGRGRHLILILLEYSSCYHLTNLECKTFIDMKIGRTA